ncbi:MAG TPA: hypothetical protein DDY29_03905 [Rhodobacteraceae bacterium]|jgi:hypothetical protein|nr:hypothetical protein [Paracoccaceae bacterium]HBG97888.1 hypothetical protein [Paracoccaceae bacterium]
MDTTTTELAATDAIGLAFDWFDRFFGDAAGGACVDNLLLEGVEYDERTNEWKISLSFDVGRKSFAGQKNHIATALGVGSVLPSERAVRSFYFDAADGAFIRMTGA